MRFIIPYFAGVASTFLVIGGLIGSDNQLRIGIALAIIITGGAGITCFKRHKRKQKEYYDRFRSENDN